LTTFAGTCQAQPGHEADKRKISKGYLKPSRCPETICRIGKFFELGDPKK
jgi:hypothetical protein